MSDSDDMPDDDFPATALSAEPPVMPDPAILAAYLLIQEALRERNVDPVDAGADGKVVVILVPAAEWVDPAYRAWRENLRGGERPDNGFHNNLGYHGRWTTWVAEEHELKAPQTTASETFATAVAAGQHCAAFATDLQWLPRDIGYAADHTLTLSAPDPATINQVAATLCGGTPTTALPEVDAARVTPRILRLARRRHQTADQYVAKIAEILAREEAATPSAKPPRLPTSVRDAPTLSRLHGMDDAVRWGMELARDLERVRNGAIRWADVARGACLVGPPGCGKSLFARALAATCGIPLIAGSYAMWLGTGSAHQGSLLKAMRDCFKEARLRAPCILFIDEIDSFPNRQTISHKYKEWDIQVVNALLAEIDGVENRDGVILVAACNDASRVDPALLRSGRLDRLIHVGLPDQAALVEILREHLEDDLKDCDLTTAAMLCAGHTGADCERLVRGARRRARDAGRAMTLADLITEVTGSRHGMSADDLWTCAVHEAGHAVVYHVLVPGSVQVVNLTGSGPQPGSVTGIRSSVFLTRDSLRLHLAGLLAGRAAEEVVLGVPTSGAGGSANSDLALATRWAAAALASLGLEPEFGMAWLSAVDLADLPRLLSHIPGFGLAINQAIKDCYAEAIRIVRHNEAAVVAVANAVLEKRAITGDDVASLVAASPVDHGAPWRTASGTSGQSQPE